MHALDMLHACFRCVACMLMIYEPRREKTGFTKTQISFAVTAKLISAFVFAT